MRDLRKNQRRLFYANYTRTEESAFDEYGNEISGGESFVYEKPQEIYLYIGNVTGEVRESSIGGVENYDILLSTASQSCPVKENAKLWIDKKPTESHDYEVKKKAPSLNGLVYGATKVRVDG